MSKNKYIYEVEIKLELKSIWKTDYYGILVFIVVKMKNGHKNERQKLYTFINVEIWFIDTKEYKSLIKFGVVFPSPLFHISFSSVSVELVIGL